jgi:ketosteroid isomerase-like protein
LDWADPEIEFEIVDGPQPGVWKGLAAMAEAWGDVLRGTAGVRSEAEDFRDLDSDRVLALTWFHGRGRTSGVVVEGPGANAFEFRGGKVTRLAFYWDRERALADLGLEE